MSRDPDETILINLDPPDLPDPDDEKTDPAIILPLMPPPKAQVPPPPRTAPAGSPTNPNMQRPGTNPSMQRPGTNPNMQRPGTNPSMQRPGTPPGKSPVKMPEMGALDVFMKDPEVTEIMVNDLRNVMIEKGGKLMFSGFAYQAIDELNRLVRNIIDITGRVLSPDSPFVDTMLPDGSRVNIVGPPLTTHGACITIRKFPSNPLTIENLIGSEMMDRRMAHFLSVCVQGRMNILISGGTGSGKTTLLNTLLTFIPRGERLVTIEDTPELNVSHFNSVRLQTKLQTPTSPGISSRDLLANALRMRPDRVIIGECRRSEAFDMLQAMNTGHEGSMTTLHSNTPRDSLSRLETLCMMAGIDLPVLAIRKQIASAIDLIVQIKRFRNGKRRIVAISEITGMESETITLQEIFLFDHEQRSTNLNAGVFKCTGFVPTFLDKLRENGIELPGNYFN